MGLSVAMSNALSGMDTTQKALDVLSRNVSNAGTPGYHRQTININEYQGTNSSYARFASVDRAFVESLQRHYNQELSGSGYADVKLEFLHRMEVFLGKPGDTTSLDSVYLDFENALESLATSPDDSATRANVLSRAQTLVGTLNRLTSTIQELREETEAQIGGHVVELNQMLSTLEQVNNRLIDQSDDATARASLLDQRDRLVGQVAELMDVRVDYRPDDTVSIMTRSGLGLLDISATVLNFSPAGNLSANSVYDIVDSENGVGTLTAITPSGLTFDVVDQNILQSGRILSLINMRDDTLSQMQGQLDEIAAGLAQALSTIETAGTAVTGPPDGFDIDLADIQPGNSFTVNYTDSGVESTVRVVRVDDGTKLPMDYVDPNGERVIGLDFAGGLGPLAAALDTALGANITVSIPSGTTLRIVDDGVGANSDINSLVSHTTVIGEQGNGLGINLFTDVNNISFTNSLDGEPQKRGFAGRISINTSILADTELLVKYDSSVSLGDADRAEFIRDQLTNVQFTSDNYTSPEMGGSKLTGNTQSMISQMLNFQGTEITVAESISDAAGFSLEAVNQRMDSEYSVNVDKEMARLMELQNAYAASARVISTIRELLDELMRI